MLDACPINPWLTYPLDRIGRLGLNSMQPAPPPAHQRRPRADAAAGGRGRRGCPRRGVGYRFAAANAARLLCSCLTHRKGMLLALCDSDSPVPRRRMLVATHCHAECRIGLVRGPRRPILSEGGTLMIPHTCLCSLVAAVDSDRSQCDQCRVRKVLSNPCLVVVSQ